MIENLDRKLLTKGVSFFVGHAITRLRGDRSARTGWKGAFKSFASRIAFESTVLKLTSLKDHPLEVPEERDELLRIIQEAQDLASDAWKDSRWSKLRLPGNAVRELKELVQAAQGIQPTSDRKVDSAAAAA